MFVFILKFYEIRQTGGLLGVRGGCPGPPTFGLVPSPMLGTGKFGGRGDGMAAPFGPPFRLLCISVLYHSTILHMSLITGQYSLPEDGIEGAAGPGVFQTDNLLPATKKAAEKAESGELNCVNQSLDEQVYVKPKYYTNLGDPEGKEEW